jgi:hypothetical protein
MLIAGATAIANARSAVLLSASVTRKVNDEGPAVDGVPFMLPPELSVNPAGSDPVAIVHT